MSAERRFDRTAFDAALATRRLGRLLIVRAEAGSTNDVAWEALAEGRPDGTTVIAESQLAGRGRAGRSWFMAEGRGLALSVMLHVGCDRRQTGLLPLVAGLALAEGLETLGLYAALKWPNDLQVHGRKLSGILAETRRQPDGGDAAVVGVGVNVLERAADFPPDLRGSVTSLAIEGFDVTRETVAAAFLGAFEPRWDELQEGSRAALLAAWSARSPAWGHELTARTPGGEVRGVALRLDGDGALVLRASSGDEITVVAGDVGTGDLEARA